MKQKLQTKLAAVRGLGSAKDGTHHWWMQRVTSLALVPLSIWFVYSLMELVQDPSAAQIASWLSDPIPAITMLFFLGVSFYHAKLGMQVVIEDYVHSPCWKYGLLFFTNFTLFTLAVMSIMAVLKLHFLDVLAGSA